ncbi:MAG TPA: hypothetical protein VF297_05245 [Pyrinomonadaceae bacterium]
MNQRTREEKLNLLRRFKKPTDLELPVSGLVVEVVRPPLAAWVAAGQVPESMFGAATSVLRSGNSPVTPEDVDIKEIMDFIFKVARASIKWPRVLGEGEQPPAENDEALLEMTAEEARNAAWLDLSVLPPDDLMALLTWCMNGAPNVPVQTEDGEVSAEALRSFHSNGGVPGLGTDGGEVRAEAVGTAGNP